MLQPTSPFRKPKHILEAIGLYKGKVDMVASVKATKANPYFTLFEKNERNHLRPIKQSTFTRRQDCPEVYELNGAVYVINTDSLKTKGMANFDFIIPYEMDRLASTDLDEELDWKWAEFLIQEKLMDL